MDLSIFFLIAIFFFGFVFIYLIIRNQRHLDSREDQNRVIHDRLDRTAQSLNQLQSKLGEITEIGRGIKDFSDLLKAPKTRGNIGEQILNEVLAQNFPKESFYLQYGFSTGEKVDAAIKTTGGLIAIDSKFPMENFRAMAGAITEDEKKFTNKAFERDIKNHIESISKKYIVPSEGTSDYAVMYVPSEAVYYEVATNSDLMDFASRKRVLPVSPTTFYAYMRSILMSFEGQKVEERAKEIVLAIKAIEKDYVTLQEYVLVLQKHMNNATNMLNNTVGILGQIGNKISQTRVLGRQVNE